MKTLRELWDAEVRGHAPSERTWQDEEARLRGVLAPGRSRLVPIGLVALAACGAVALFWPRPKPFVIEPPGSTMPTEIVFRRSAEPEESALVLELTTQGEAQ